MQYHVTIINLFRPFTCDIQRQQPLYNDAFRICASAATTISALIERYRVKYTLRRIALVAIVSQGMFRHDRPWLASNVQTGIAHRC